MGLLCYRLSKRFSNNHKHSTISRLGCVFVLRLFNLYHVSRPTAAAILLHGIKEAVGVSGVGQRVSWTLVSDHLRDYLWGIDLRLSVFDKADLVGGKTNI